MATLETTILEERCRTIAQDYTVLVRRVLEHKEQLLREARLFELFRTLDAGLEAQRLGMQAEVNQHQARIRELEASAEVPPEQP